MVIVSVKYATCFIGITTLMKTTPTNGQCSLCAGGAAPPNPSKLLISSDNTTCNSLAVEATESNSTIGDEVCNEYLLIGLTECDCPREGLCTLCEEEGSAIPEPNKSISFDYTCSDLVLEALLESKDSPTCQNWRATAGVYCGCPNPVAVTGYCRLCGEENLLPEPSRPAGANPRTTCMTLEFNEAGLSCDVLQSTYADLCCDTSVSDAPSLMPTPTATSKASTLSFFGLSIASALAFRYC
ncbi:hypothetical protein FisN_18Lh298 [Fistulifera solaris]|uniref:Uncharacterized protein n=1 Tax=Fistulifera solaris TaxID=1519565 RepID=A0A1Z5JUP2_FISSO|nr:hypothetical protein FisN_18Lh298 [Fistulifera solaris]|eukprot:GAX17639.1 hypothetical protein FisN_18Lh298 [Fistulifera solaris]